MATRLKKEADDICAGCLHSLSKQHRHYVNGVNRHGSSYVCSVSGCSLWRDCREPLEAKPPRKAGGR